MHYTVGFNYYYDYILYMSITDGLADLEAQEASDYYKIIYIKSGPCHFVMNDKEFVLTGACVICMNERDKIRFINVVENDAKILWFKPTVINEKFTFDVVRDLNGSLSITESQDTYYLMQFTKDAVASMKILSLHTMDASAIEYKFQMISEQLVKQNANGWPCRSRSYLFEILFCLTRQREEEEVPNNVLLYQGESRLAVNVIYYLQSCYNQKITIEKLAEQFHTNRTTLINDFKKSTGQSVNRFLMELRLKMASTLLRDTELSIDEISERTGFSDISYFSKVFKKRLCYTPLEYRRINH